MDFKKIENKWAVRWVEEKIYRADDSSSKEKKYILVEFPYPSGTGLHIGHAFTMTGGDAFARYHRMSGKEVLFPIGHDAFGLPTENYAIKVKRNPKEVTRENCDNFRKQMINLGFSYDWDREINTTDPDYYKWTQWIFIKLFEKGLAEKQSKDINWCPSCKIGLANEEVIDGNCERCGEQTTKKQQEQWVLKITEYADKLIDGLKETDYENHIKTAQIKWIDRTFGITIDYPIIGEEDKVVSCYSTRPDTNYGATFIVIAPENLLALEITDDEHRKEVVKYIDEAKKKSERDRIADHTSKTGVFTGRYVLNRLTNKEIPVYVADFVVADTGTGAVVGVPAHDERDFDFAKNYDIEIIPVIVPNEGEWDFEKGAYTDVDNGKVINSEVINDLPVKEALEKIMDYLEEKGWGKRSKNYHLRDWIFSRQHYWGEPIPMVHCEKCGWVPEKEENLPIELPDVEHYEPTDTGESPLAVMEDWVNTKCPKCGGDAKRETDVMPNWAGSSWYFLRYLDSQNDKEFASKEKQEMWMPVNVYIGGSEHTTLHVLYSRFWHKFLFDEGEVTSPEPYYTRIEHGVILGPDGKRMSKSKGNIISPEDITSKYGVDTIRTYLMFMGPFRNTMAWNTNTVVGVQRFLDKIYAFVSDRAKNLADKSSENVVKVVNKTKKRVTDSLERFSFNTAVAAMMEMMNEISSETEVAKSEIEDILLLIAPFAPFMAEELWEVIGNGFSIHNHAWPKFDEKLLKEDKIIIPIQVNGKVRGEVSVKSDASEEDIKSAALECENVKKHVGDSKVKKFVYVPGRIANIVV